MNKEELYKKISLEGDEKTFDYKGLTCTIIRHHSLMHLCGYIDLPEWIGEYDKHYEEISVNCHGGLTYADRNGKFWRIGFDCAHSGDLTPYLLQSLPSMVMTGEVYRDMEYVEKELVNIVDELDNNNNSLVTIKSREKKIDNLENE